MPNADIDRLSLLMIETSRLIRGRLHAFRNAACPLSHPQIATLSCILDSETPLLMKEIAARLRVAPPSVTPVIEGLASAGYLKRLTDRRDRRAVRVALTPKGRRTLTSARKAHAEKLRAVLSALDPEDRESLSRILERLAKKFRA